MSENKFIPLSVPNLKGKELEYITNAVETEWVSTAGPYVSDFEEKIAKYVGTAGAVACQSGTAGLHIALLLCGVTPNDMVIVPTLSFIASVNPVKYIGAEPMFMDCDDSLCIDPVKLENFITGECELKGDVLFHKKTGRRIPAFVVVDVFGNMADMEALTRISDKYHIKMVEDACEAIGTCYTEGEFKGRFAGSFGTVGVFSFNGNKIITCGGGGMIVSNDVNLLKEAKHLTTQAKADEANFIHDEIGFNYRLTNLQAALGLAQLEQLEGFIDVKIKNYNKYVELLDGRNGLKILPFRRGTRSNHWFYSLVVPEEFESDSHGLIDKLKAEGIQSRPIWGLIHEQKPYEGSYTYDIAAAKDYWKKVINLPCSTSLTEADVIKVADVILNAE